MTEGDMSGNSVVDLHSPNHIQVPFNAKLVSKPSSINSRSMSAIGRKKTDYTAAMNATAINDEEGYRDNS